MGENELINELINREQQVNKENQKNLNVAKGLAKGIYSGEVLPTLNNLWRMASSAYKYYIAPETPYIEGTPPTVGISPSSTDGLIPIFVIPLYSSGSLPEPNIFTLLA